MSSAGPGGGGAPLPPASAPSGLPAVPGGTANSANGVGSGSGAGGNSRGGAQGGIGAALIALLTLVLLRLAGRAAAVPVWRAYLPEVPPA
jgi:hypothetical protein